MREVGDGIKGIEFQRVSDPQYKQLSQTKV